VKGNCPFAEATAAFAAGLVVVDPVLAIVDDGATVLP
jgi:hypothetical protein